MTPACRPLPENAGGVRPKVLGLGSWPQVLLQKPARVGHKDVGQKISRFPLCSFLGLGFLIFRFNGGAQIGCSEKALLLRELDLRAHAAVNGGLRTEALGTEEITQLAECVFIWHTYNLSTWEVETGGSAVQGHPPLYEFRASLGYIRLCVKARRDGGG